MPNRILRDYTDSAAFDGISAEAERLFVRLLTKADDFGRFHANPKLVKAACFPLAEDLRANTIAAWLTELSDRQLVFCYTSGTGEYLCIPKFGEPRAKSSKYPAPPGDLQASANICAQVQADESKCSRIRLSDSPIECESDAPAPLPRGCARRKPQGWPSDEAQARTMAENSMVSPDLAATFWHHFEGSGYWPQGNFISAMKAKQGFKAQDLADKLATEDLRITRREDERAEAATNRPTMKL